MIMYVYICSQSFKSANFTWMIIYIYSLSHTIYTMWLTFLGGGGIHFQQLLVTMFLRSVWEVMKPQNVEPQDEKKKLQPSTVYLPLIHKTTNRISAVSGLSSMFPFFFTQIVICMLSRISILTNYTPVFNSTL